MEITPQPTFLAAVKEIMKTGVAAVALSMEDIFFLANDHCPTDQRIRYGTFMRFINTLDEYGDPPTISKQTTILLEIYDYIKAQQAKQKMAMLNGIMEAQKDWRRFVWLLQLQEKQERQKAAEARQLAKEAKEREQATAAATKLADTANGKPAPAPPATGANTLPHAHGSPQNANHQDHRQLGKVG